MLTVTSESFHDKVNVPNEEIILNGPPTDLRGHIHLRNDQKEQLRVRALPIVHTLKKGVSMGDGFQLKLSVRLKPGEEKLLSLVHQVHPQTPPGIYESSLMVGGIIRKLKIVVQPNIEVDIFPIDFYFQGTEPSTTHSAEITITNTGNLSFQLPDVKHLTTLDMDFICRATATAIRAKGNEGYEAMLDELTKNVHDDMADWVTASIKESGQSIAPGNSIIAHLTMTLPKNTDARKDYMGNIRIWDKLVNYYIKSNHDKKSGDAKQKQ